jgi:hypothetical protein
VAAAHATMQGQRGDAHVRTARRKVRVESARAGVGGGTRAVCREEREGKNLSKDFKKVWKERGMIIS